MPLESDRQIVELEYLSSELAPDTPTKKHSIVDVRCIDNYKRQFIVEMQMFWGDVFYNRILFNAGKAFVKQLDSGENYHYLANTVHFQRENYTTNIGTSSVPKAV